MEMPLLTLKKFSETILELPQPEGELERWNHVFEPEYHQKPYVDACIRAAKAPGAFQLGNPCVVQKYPYRGVQPIYADDDDDPESLEYEGMITATGRVLGSDHGKRNVCAMKSAVVRRGYLDFDLARSVTRAFYNARKARSAVEKNDLLINSTGDGTIGRAAVFDRDFPAVVDGHITIVRFKDPDLAWYTAAYLLSDQGQNQIYRYINGSSGQVEIYPQDIARLWIPPKAKADVRAIANKLRDACTKHSKFFTDMKAALSML
jgi:hypothetical protein